MVLHEFGISKVVSSCWLRESIGIHSMIKVSIYLPLLDTKSIDLIGDKNDKFEVKSMPLLSSIR
jgi:hypothetical protein